MASGPFCHLCMKVSVNDAIPEKIQVLVNLHGDPQSFCQSIICFLTKKSQQYYNKEILPIKKTGNHNIGIFRMNLV